MDTIVSEDRPDLENKSEAFAAVKGIAIGAAIATAATLGLAAIPGVREAGFSGYKQALKKLLPVTAGVSGLADGWSLAQETRGQNEQNDKVRPYVEKLEADRNRLATLALNGGAQKG